MSNSSSEKQSKLIAALREGISVIQMVIFKEVKESMAERHTDRDPTELLMLAGAITNELFGTPNPEPKFVQFREQHQVLIESELGGLAKQLPHLKGCLTDALRTQVLCDKQEGVTEPGVLQTADSLGLLLKEKNIPLPSAFMSLVRGLGEQHGLIIAPVNISPEDDQSLVH